VRSSIWLGLDAGPWDGLQSTFQGLKGTFILICATDQNKHTPQVHRLGVGGTYIPIGGVDQIRCTLTTLPLIGEIEVFAPFSALRSWPAQTTPVRKVGLDRRWLFAIPLGVVLIAGIAMGVAFAFAGGSLSSGGKTANKVNGSSHNATTSGVGSKAASSSLKGGSSVSQLSETTAASASVMLWPVEDGKKWGFVDKTGTMVIAAQFDAVTAFSQGLAAVMVTNVSSTVSLWGYIDSSGAWVIKPQFVSASSFANGLAEAELQEGNDLCGYIDRTGKWVIQPQFKKGGPFSADGVAAAQEAESGSWGCIDKTGAWVIQPQFRSVLYASAEGLRVAETEDLKLGYVDKTGAWVIQPQFEIADTFSGGLAEADNSDGLYGYIDKTGTWVIHPQFRYAFQFKDGVAPVVQGDKYGLINSTGAWVLKPQLDAVAPSGVEGIWWAHKAGKWGLIDKTGAWLAQPQFETSGSASVNGLFPAGTGGKWGYIDKTGNWVIKPQFDSVTVFISV